ncbi:hypothetical protein BG003_009291 [Podila horticola]|nr:hypothetical protein BG003_009291 [Podila horticola]
MNGAQKRTVAATPSFLDKGKAVANGNGIRASNGINSTHRPSQWHIDDSDASQEDEEDNLLEEDDDANDSFYIPSKSFAQQLSTVDPSLYQGTGYKKKTLFKVQDDFCTVENFDQTSAYINHQLSVFGFSTNLQFLKADKNTASRIVTALYKMLQQHQKDAEYKEEMDLNWRRLSQDYDSTLQTLSNTKARLERSDRENVELQAKLGAVEEELRVETEKHKHTREELRSSKANLQYTKTQYAHEARRKEKEMDVLKEKIQRSISRGQSSSGSGSSVIPGGITVLNPVPRSLFGKQHVSDGEQLLKEVIEQQNAKEMEIVEENEQLRRTLYTVHVELEGLIRKKSPSKSQAVNPYGLPFEMVKEKIETEIQDALTLLSDQWTHRPPQEPTTSPTEIVIRDQRIEELERDIEKMQHELEDSTVLIQGAQKMIDNLNGGNFLAGAQDFKLGSEGSDVTAQEVEEAETKLRKQREDLAKERKKFTEACLDLGRQREELKKAKLEFEESKRTFRLDKVVSFLSFSPGSAKRTLEHSPPTSPSSSPSSASHRQQIHRAKKRMTTTPLPSFGPKLNVTGQGSARMSAITVEDSVDGEEEQEEGDETQQTLEDGDGEVHDTHDNGDVVELGEEEEEEEEEVLLRTPSRPRTSYLSTVADLGTGSKAQQKPAPSQPSVLDRPVESSSTVPKVTSKSKETTGAGSLGRIRSSLFSSPSSPSFKPSVPFTFTAKTPSGFASTASSGPTTATRTLSKASSILSSKAPVLKARPSIPLFSTPSTSTLSTHTRDTSSGTSTGKVRTTIPSSSFPFSRPTIASSNNSVNGGGGGLSSSSSTSALAAGTASALRRNQSQQGSKKPTTTAPKSPSSKQAQGIYAANQQTFLSSKK